MDDLQTKPLIPEWVIKLAVILNQEFEISPKLEKGLSLGPVYDEELAEFIWLEYQKVNPDAQ